MNRLITRFCFLMALGACGAAAGGGLAAAQETVKEAAGEKAPGTALSNIAQSLEERVVREFAYNCLETDPQSRGSVLARRAAEQNWSLRDPAEIPAPLGYEDVEALAWRYGVWGDKSVTVRIFFPEGVDGPTGYCDMISESTNSQRVFELLAERMAPEAPFSWERGTFTFDAGRTRCAAVRFQLKGLRDELICEN